MKTLDVFFFKSKRKKRDSVKGKKAIRQSLPYSPSELCFSSLKQTATTSIYYQLVETTHHSIFVTYLQAE